MSILSRQELSFYGGPRKNIWDVFEKPSEKSRTPIAIAHFSNFRDHSGIQQHNKNYWSQQGASAHHLLEFINNCYIIRQASIGIEVTICRVLVKVSATILSSNNNMQRIKTAIPVCVHILPHSMRVVICRHCTCNNKTGCTNTKIFLAYL